MQSHSEPPQPRAANRRRHVPARRLRCAARADIFQWEYINPADPSQGKQQSTTLAPDGAGVDAVPGADLSDRNLTMAYLIGADLTGAYGYYANLTNADLSQANLTNAYFAGATLHGRQFHAEANLTNANFHSATLTDADFTGAEVRGANFSRSCTYWLHPELESRLRSSTPRPATRPMT